jgi:hypothetical protein
MCWSESHIKLHQVNEYLCMLWSALQKHSLAIKMATYSPRIVRQKHLDEIRQSYEQQVAYNFSWKCFYC